ncbi:SAM-dependent methyltransferase [Phycicoccus duodecadis]|uniref:SAM-dependent MidA family methyltransferase n=1 Tax=Phycicoccus duodecadis TaxID=173053 RepID=A0A2N3YI03_9MICO|nr:SAM-dependent methyltransferase [Phycicoccus duodecadis]PKW26475.1 SAM-dependent MidA family methyltransferase [Phycicoccus duodecadis]
MDLLPWRDAWQHALYGAGGFYRGDGGPARHFITSTHEPLGATFAEGVLALADREGATHVVDVGAGRGELVTALHRLRPGLRLTAVDVVARPPGLPADVAWLVSPGGADLPDALRDLHDVLVVAHEWLDVVPCTVAEVGRDGALRTVLVDPATGTESLSDPLAGPDLAWCAQHWCLEGPAAGTRVEVGLTRDRAWAGLLSRVRSGTALAVDYGHTRATRPATGTLVGYRDGTTVPPVPDGTCDLTAHVAVDSLEQDERTTQREALLGLGLTASTPPLGLARTDPPAYLTGLARASAVTALTARRGLGDFHWVLRRIPDPRTRPGA